MSGRDRLAIFPSRANHVLMKQRIVSATKGVNLLKRKRDAIDLKLREMSAELRSRQERLDDILRSAIFSMARANYLRTDFKPATVIQSDRADAFMRKRFIKVVGVNLPALDCIIRSDGAYPLTGLAHGGRQVDEVRLQFQEALRQLVAVASLEYSVRVLTEASRSNNMRVNALEHVVIPRFQNTLNYIRDELEEYEREDFYRLKRSQAKQLKAKQEFSRMIKFKNLSPEERERLLRAGLIDFPAADVDFDLNDFLGNKKPTLVDKFVQTDFEDDKSLQTDFEGDWQTQTEWDTE